MEWLQSIVGARVTNAIELSSDLEHMRSSLPRVNHLMEKAEWWRFKSPYIEHLLKELRDAAYDAEDVLAEFDYYQLKQQIEGNTTNQLMSTLVSFIRILVSNSSGKVKDLQNKLDSICGKLESELGPLSLPDGPNPYGKALQHETTSFLPDKVFGREELVEKVLNLMLRCGDDAESSNEASSSSEKCAKRRKIYNFSILPIVGMGGMGKTTLAQQIYNDERVKKHFDLRIWICVSDYFDLKKITKEMIESANKANKEMIESANIELATKEGLRNYQNQIGFGENLGNLDSLQHILKEKVALKRYLLVLDDVWHEKIRDWESLCNPLRFGNKESMILITTREPRIAEVVGTLDPIEVEGLPDDIFWKLFKKCAFGFDGASAYPELESIGKKIASKLKGCPLLAKTLGGILCGNITIKHWRNILDSELWQLKQYDGSFLAALRVSYQYLPIHLKHCFLICSLFPKDFGLNKNDLGPIWMTDGIIAHEKDNFYYDNGYEYFTDLTRRAFILCYDEKYFLHGHMHDLAKSLSLDLCYCQEENDWSLRNHNSARHLSVYRKPIELIDREIGKCKKLRSLLFRYDFSCEIKLGTTTLVSLFNQLPYLRLLDLRNCNIMELPENIGNLKLLFYLNLKFNVIRYLPDSLCQLYNLEVIDVTSCPIESFPYKFSNLINLRLIENVFPIDNFSPVITKIPRIGMLTCLEKLEKFKVLKKEGHKIDELKNMTRLRGQLRITNLENVDGRHDAAEACLNNKEHLTSLKLSWSPSRGTSSGIGNHVIDEDTIEGLQPHPNIGCLDINNYGGRTLPSWLQTEMLPHLFELEISGCSNLESLESLFVPHQLSSLEVLFIKDCENILSLPLEWISNSSLIELSIVKCPRLSGHTNLILPSSLIYLHLDSCGEFDKSLSGCFQNVHPLKDLTLKNCQHITSVPSQVTNHLTGVCLSNCAELQYLDFTHSCSLVRVKIEKCPELLQLDLSKADKEAPIVPNKQLDLLDIDNTSLLKLSFLRTPRCLLRYLNITNSPEERMFIGDARGWLSGHENLLDLQFMDCSNLESLPEELHTLTTLQHLRIFNCPKIQSLPENGLPSSLKSLFYSRCHPALREQLKQHDKALACT